MTTAAVTNTQISAQQRFTMIALSAGRIALVTTFAIMLISVLHPDVRSSVRSSLVKDYRSVISVAEGDLEGNGSRYKVTKIKTREALSLEIYKELADGGQQLVEKIAMPDTKDGYFTFNGHASNLAIDDVDGDGKAEILVPTFDNNLVGRLTVYHLDAEGHSFSKTVR